MTQTPPVITESEHVELYDRLWGDPRRRDDRSEFSECEHCGRAVRWITNLRSASGSSLQIVARPVTTATWFEPAAHAGLVAVFTNRAGFTLSKRTTQDEVEGAFLYRCHWDVCAEAKRVRDRMHRDRYGTAESDELAATPDAMRRYAEWHSSRS